MTKLRHVIEAQQFSRESIGEIFKQAEMMEEFLKQGYIPPYVTLEEKIMLSLFCEESTRTRISFEAAMARLHGDRIPSTDAKRFSAMAKGETLEHTIQVISGCGNFHCRLGDVIVLRHDEAGAAKRAAKVSAVPIINAGDGPGQHPTQALLDTFMFAKIVGQLHNLSTSRVIDKIDNYNLAVAIVGGLALNRAARSFAYLLSKFNIKIYFVAPKGFEIEPDIKDHLREHGRSFVEVDDIREVASEVDFGYIVRVQKNRKQLPQGLIKLYQANREKYSVTPEVIKLTEKKGTYFTHPMPIDNAELEIRPEVENNPRVIFLKHAGYGLPIRMALLTMLDWDFFQNSDKMNGG